jgi:glycosyltransferase involved in cell wall biosynthesis
MEITVPIVSVLMITYNHESFISQAIEGVLMQKTNFPIELIIGEDNSKDKTRSIVKEFEFKNPKIIVAQYPEMNRGAMNNFITVMQSARGKYIALCEGDDYWTDPYKLQKQVEFLEGNAEFSMCFHNALVVYENSREKSHLFTSIDKVEYDIQDIIQKMWFISTPSIVFRSVLYEKPEWLNYVSAGDYALQLVLATKGKIGAINEVMAVYRRHNTSMGTKLKIGFSSLKMTETLSFFNYSTNFKYNSMIQNKIFKIREGLYLHFLSELPLWNKIINPDFLKIKLKNLQLKITKYLLHIIHENSKLNK